MNTKKGKYNLYPCKNTYEALSLVSKKKYNKIILITNFREGGLEFIIKARQTIGNYVLALVAASEPGNLNSIIKCKNTLFSNKPEFTEEYLKCFNYDLLENERKAMILNLKNKMEKYYNAKFNIEEHCLDFPKYKASGRYSELSF